MVERRYWDSDCFLGWLQDEPTKAEKCQSVFTFAERGEILIVTSAFTLAEVLHLRPKDALPSERRALVEELFNRKYVRTLMVTRRIGEKARDLVWDHGIRPKDAIHVASALAADVTVLNTFDRALIGKSGRVGTPPLVIEHPAVDEPELHLEVPRDEAQESE